MNLSNNRYSIGKRFIITFSSNILRGAINLLTGLMIARWLGPTDYGRMAFLLVSFLAFKQLLDMFSSSAFFTFISKEKRSHKFINLYWYWVATQLFFSILVIYFLLPETLLNTLWKGETRALVLLALIAVFFQNMVWTIASNMGEACRETLYVQKIQNFVVFTHFVVMLLLWWLGQLMISFIFIALILEWALASWLVIKIYPRLESINRDDTVKSVFFEFWDYCLPFIPYVWLGALYIFTERWMLQHWGGSVEQSYYAIAKQFGVIALLATSSILNIAWKEISEAYHNGDLKLVEKFYKNFSYALYLIGAIIAGYFIPWALEILQLTVGSSYIEGVAVFMLMLLYPVHQSMGQIGGMMLMATSKTRLKAILGVITMLVGIVTSYLMMAPADSIIPGLGMASKGLAIKMILVQIIEVNVLAWFIARNFNWKFEWLYQVSILSIAISIGWIIKIILVSLIQVPSIFLMLISGIIYFLILFYLIYFLPKIFGFKQEQIDYINSSVRKIKKVILIK